ncbi:N-acetyltransferase [Leucobacter weissii]|uniref:N-acetyltransferase n=1 Tax=Leucobacter weissii TaxID=1983706 RepID=A0A939MLC7_9MICO|nr:GNAT family N-acetyltransferase [Leucobacter weissii]MBO1900932.1 N-acetyltransferase [Leucobacter weissii]
MTRERFEVEHRDAESRYVLIDRGEDGSGAQEIGEESYVDVAADDAAAEAAGDARPRAGAVQRVLFHTFVSEAYAGQGLASMLVRTVVDDLIAAGRAVVPVCPYVAGWLRKHPEYAAHEVAPTPRHLRAVRRQQR